MVLLLYGMRHDWFQIFFHVHQMLLDAQVKLLNTNVLFRTTFNMRVGESNLIQIMYVIVHEYLRKII
jgi:hypothetical protein